MIKGEYDASACALCPRRCRADRLHGKRGFCGCDNDIYVARAALHMWEEPCITGDAGSGTVFFSGCSLRCVFCQNGRIADCTVGKKISQERLAAIFLEQQERGAANINLVTPTHYIPHIVGALEDAKAHGLSIPIVYNTGGYELVSSLRMLDGLVDVYLPDMKYMDSRLAGSYSMAEDYPETAKAAIAEMFRQVGEPKFDDNGIMLRGMIVRHLVLPGSTSDSKEIVRYLHETYGNRIYMSIMNQYTPMEQFTQGGRMAELYPKLGRRITEREYAKVVDYAIDIGVENAFIQDKDTAKESYIPDFDYEGV